MTVDFMQVTHIVITLFFIRSIQKLDLAHVCSEMLVWKGLQIMLI